MPDLCEKAQSVQAYAETSVNAHAPSETSRWVRRPASWSRSSRSRPIAPPSVAASSSLSRASVVERSGTFCCDRLFLRGDDVLHPPGGEVEERAACHDPDRDGRDRTGHRLREPEAVERAPRRDVGTGDRGAAGAAV